MAPRGARSPEPAAVVFYFFIASLLPRERCATLWPPKAYKRWHSRSMGTERRFLPTTPSSTTMTRWGRGGLLFPARPIDESISARRRPWYSPSSFNRPPAKVSVADPGHPLAGNMARTMPPIWNRRSSGKHSFACRASEGVFGTASQWRSCTGGRGSRSVGQCGNIAGECRLGLRRRTVLDFLCRRAHLHGPALRDENAHDKTAGRHAGSLSSSKS